MNVHITSHFKFMPKFSIISKILGKDARLVEFEIPQQDLDENPEQEIIERFFAPAISILISHLKKNN